MGVAAQHGKLVSKQDVESEDFYFDLDELMEHSPEFVKQNEHLISEMVWPDKCFYILIFENEDALQAFNSEGTNVDVKALLVGNPAELTTEIASLEALHHLDAGNCFELHWPERESFRRRVYPQTYHRKMVIYYNQVGYCKSCMDGEFYQEFPQLKLYFKKEDILKAYTYLRTDGDYEERDEEFRRDFVDSFEEGISVFFQY